MTRQVRAARGSERGRLDDGRGDGRPDRADGVTDEGALLDAILTSGDVRALFQPIVEIGTGAPVGYEALTRGPGGHPLHRPDALFAAARRRDRLGELDTLCRGRALDAARHAGMRPPAVLFVNVEPAALAPTPTSPTSGEPALHPSLPLLRERGVQVVAELTERDLTAEPAHLLAFAERMRAAGCGIALDDVGLRPASLALMPLLRPDVVKLDLRLVQDRPDAAIAQTMTAVTAFAEAHDAAVVAEGVETLEHERVALSLGATHGQGWRYGRPAPPDEALRVPSAPSLPIVVRTDRSRVVRDGGFALASRGRVPRRGTKRLLLEVSRLLERQATELGGLAVVLTTVEDDHRFGEVVRARYAAIAEHAAFVAAIGRGVGAEPAPGVRGADLEPGDPMCHEWNLVVVGPHFAAALVARDQHDTGPDLDRRFEYVLTYDRPTVLETARSLLSRVGPGPTGPARHASGATGVSRRRTGDLGGPPS